MYYITVDATPRVRQMTIEELIFGANKDYSKYITNNKTNTVTRCVKEINIDIKVSDYIWVLKNFNDKYKYLKEVPRQTLYNSFVIPKKSGGVRHIDAPNDELMEALREFKHILEDIFNLKYHTNAYAYIKNRSIVDAIKKHQVADNHWFAKFDLSNFFGNTTPEFVIKMAGMIFPLSEILKSEEGKKEFSEAIDLAFLNGGLPQGTPLSPTLTNIIMIPVDYSLTKKLLDYRGKHYTYTRYADDFTISCKYQFRFKSIEQLINDTLKEFDAPYKLNSKKTRYGSRAGSNWNLGLMLNKDNEITVGHKNKKRFQAMLTNYIMDKRNDICWEPSDIQSVLGLRSYYIMIEGDTIHRIIYHINNKFNCDVIAMMKADLRL